MNDFIWATSDINHVAYLTSLCGYEVKDIRSKINEKNGKQITVFVFYESQQVINAALCDYINGDISKFNQTRSELLTLIRQSNQLSSEEILDKINGS